MSTTSAITETARHARRVAYEKAAMWVVFLLILYVLRHFFFIIFLTFIISYIMRNLVKTIVKRLSPQGVSLRLERLVTLVCFIGLLYSAYGIGRYIAPKLVSEGHELVRKITVSDQTPRMRVDGFLQKLVGGWVFTDQYGSVEDQRFIDALDRAREQDPELKIEQFEREERARLTKEWQRGPVAQKIEEQLADYLADGARALGAQVGALLPRLVLFPFQLGLVLLLSFFITMDIPRMMSGLERLRHSRVRDVYAELAPSLASFGILIGRSFQAQAVIAFVNMVLTFALMQTLGIQNRAFLSAIVFLCSFIPVLGVVFSGIPITVMAITQEGGSFALAAWAIVGILVVHFIETSILNPKIIGDMLHLHPVLVLTILAIGEHFFGVWGLLLGVPISVYVIRFVILREGIPGLIPPPDEQPVP